MTGAAISSNAKHAIAFMVIIGCVFQFVVWLTAVSAFGSEEPEQATPVAASTAPTTEAPEPAPTPTETTEAPKPEPTKPKATEPPKPKPAPVKLYRVTSVLDGDTVDLSNGETVRLIGIDAPEKGQCGADRATRKLDQLVDDKRVVLVKGARDDEDRDGRWLRYIDVKDQDAGAHLISAGLAKPRYNSTDGYGEHDREKAYASLYDTAKDAPTCPKPKPKPAPEPRKRSGGGSEPWNRPGPDLDCSDIGHPVDIDGEDYHRLDADGDGTGCDNS